jgi:two-component system NtrC family sensor kinase
MRLPGKLRLGLAAKLALCVIASTAAFFALFGYINQRMARTNSEDLVRKSADRLANIMLRSTRYAMLQDDRKALVNIIQELGSEPGIQRIRVFDQTGRITLSTDAREVNTAGPPPGPEGARTFTDAQGQRVLAVNRLIENSAACSNAACHYHPSSQKILGAIDADLSLAQVDAQMAQHQSTLRWFLLGAIVFGCGAAVAFMWIAVYRPVKELIRGTHRVADGDLGYRLPVRSDDELGDLAASFNKMTVEVADVQAHIEEQVRRKTAELEKVHKTLLNSEKMASIGKLAATVAHEINNPLFGILTYARLVLRELLKHDLPNRDELAEQLQTIERESKRCGELVKNLLTFSRQQPSNREPNDLNTIVHRATLLVKHKLDMQSIELTESLAPNLPPVECDANQIQQVVLVLMVNA